MSVDVVSVVPIWPTFVRPVLEVLSSGETLSRREVTSQAMDFAELTEEARAERLESGGLRAEGRVGWAITHLNKAGWIERVSRAQYRITDRDRAWLAEHPEGLSDFTTANRTFAEFWPKPSHAVAPTVTVGSETDTVSDPEEQIADGIGRTHAEIAADLLSRLHDNEPSFFEQAVVDLLVAMGYGGADERATVTSQSNDAGIDGIIDQDTLGLSRVYVQAKRYAQQASVGRPELQAFVGALSGKADGGVFITTGHFSQGAHSYASSVPTRVILIDGERLTSLMIRYGVGVQTKRTVQIVEVDEDFFE
jgi:restriction system protein